jgi:hypothetical protein
LVATTTPSPYGGDALSPKASLVFSTAPDPADRRSFPPYQRLTVVELATTEDPAGAGCPTGSWSLDDIALVINQRCLDQEFLSHLQSVEQTFAQGNVPALPLLAMSRSTVARILAEADLKPHRSTYWLTSHDPQFQAKAQEICQLYLDAPRLFAAGELVICTDEKTGILIRQRKYPTLPVRPGQPRRREHEYIRHGARHLTASFVVATGQVVHDLGLTHNSADFAAHLRHVVKQLPAAPRYHWVLDNVSTHWHLVVCQAVAQLCGIDFEPKKLKTGKQRRAFLCDPSHKQVFHFTPKHGSWLNQAELFFSVISRKLLSRDDFAGVEDFLARIEQWLAWYNQKWAHPYRWTYAGTPLVRDTPFSRTRAQQKRGRAPFSDRPKFYQRLFFPPRPYHKASPT